MEDVGRMWQRQARLGIAELQRADGRKYSQSHHFAFTESFPLQPTGPFCLPTHTNSTRTARSRLPNPPRKSGTDPMGNTTAPWVAPVHEGVECRPLVDLSQARSPRKTRTSLPGVKTKATWSCTRINVEGLDGWPLLLSLTPPRPTAGDPSDSPLGLGSVFPRLRISETSHDETRAVPPDRPPLDGREVVKHNPRSESATTRLEIETRR